MDAHIATAHKMSYYMDVVIKNMTVRFKLQTLRERHPQKPTQRAMGDFLGMTESNYRKLETNKLQSVKLEILDALCQFFDCEVGDILFYEPTDGKSA
jgi:DNA-binding Xre family transcriptional regulator